MNAVMNDLMNRFQKLTVEEKETVWAVLDAALFKSLQNTFTQAPASCFSLEVLFGPMYIIHTPLVCFWVAIISTTTIDLIVGHNELLLPL
jgi:uncharacterized membrane protein